MKNSSKTTIRRTLSFILTLVLIFIPFTSMVSGETISTGVVSNPETKLTENLKTYLETVDNDEYIPIYIWLTDYDEAVFYSLLSKRLGTTITAQTEEAYIGNKVAEKTEAFENRLEEMKADSSAYGLQATEAGEIDIKSFSPMLFRATANISSIMTDTEIENCLNSGMSSREIINLSQRNEFLSSYRTTRKALNNSITDSFQQKLDLGKCRNIYPSVGLTYITLEAKKSYINTISAYEQVEYIDLKMETEAYNTVLTPTSDELGTFFDIVEMDTQYSKTGAGITVGVLELKADEPGIQFDPFAPHLINKEIATNVIYDSNKPLHQHATNTLSLLGGAPVTNSVGYFVGVAPDVSLAYTNLDFYSGATDDSKFEQALDWLTLTANVNIINMSFRLVQLRTMADGVKIYHYEYSNIDKILDSHILDYRVICTVASGNVDDYEENMGEISSPALAYNAITVGNAGLEKITVANPAIKYSMFPHSDYIQEAYLTNKPDIVALGTKVGVASRSETEEQEDTIRTTIGTSNSAPIVAGAAALVMQANTNLIGKPDAVKAILMGSADENILSPNLVNYLGIDATITTSTFDCDNEKIQNISSNLMHRSGAGLLNIEAAIRMANSNTVYHYQISGEDPVFGLVPVNLTTETYTFTQNTTIEFGLVFEKNNSLYVNDDAGNVSQFLAQQNNLDIQIIDSSGNVVFESTGTLNNTEFYTCTFNETGNYSFKIISTGIKGEGNVNVTFFVTCACTEKMLSHSNYIELYHTISCNNANCGFSCKELHRIAKVEKTVYDVELTFEAYYLPKKSIDRGDRNMPHLGEIYLSSGAESENYEVEVCMPYNGSTQTTATGEIITRTFEMVVRRKSDNTYLFPLVTVTMRVDYFDQTVYLS